MATDTKNQDIIKDQPDELYQNHIIIVDDEGTKSETVKVTEERLCNKGYSVSIVQNPRDVLNFSKEEMRKYPVFIIDYDMPAKMKDLIPKIKSANLFAYVIVYTAFPNLDRFKVVREITILGADFWVEKADPDMENEMYERIGYAFRRLDSIYATIHPESWKDSNKRE